MANITSAEKIIVFALIATIIILIGVITILDIISRKKQKLEESENLNSEKIKETFNEKIKESLEQKTLETSESINQNNTYMTNSNHVKEIKYVEEDEELEKTKAKLELEQLKEELLQQEAAKEQVQVALKSQDETIQEEKIAPVEATDNIIENNVETETIISDEKAIEPEIKVATQEIERPEVSEIASAIGEELKKEETETKEANLSKVNAIQEDLNELLKVGIEEKIAVHEDEQEKNAIISVEEFNKVSDSLYDSNEITQNAYEDEGNEPISLNELEILYNTREMKVVKLDDFNTIKDEEKKNIIAAANIKKLEDLPPIALEKKFKSTPFISPVYGISQNQESIELEQTANLDKLNEEIKKTNEFLKTLKELQKNLN